MTPVLVAASSKATMAQVFHTPCYNWRGKPLLAVRSAFSIAFLGWIGAVLLFQRG